MAGSGDPPEGEGRMITNGTRDANPATGGIVDGGRRASGRAARREALPAQKSFRSSIHCGQ